LVWCISGSRAFLAFERVGVHTLRHCFADQRATTGGCAASRSARSVSTLSIASSSWAMSCASFSEDRPNSARRVACQLEFQPGDLGLGHHRIARQIGNDLL
jgi:hypothetical protein